MELYVVRHGIAEEPEAGKADADRALTGKGRRRTREAAEGLRVLGCRPERVVTSPFVRADQTARIMARILCPDAPLEVLGSLAPGATARDVVRGLRGCPEQSVMIVGHAPDVSAIAGGLLTRGHLDVEFDKAATCCIFFEGTPALASGRLVWLLQPRALRALEAEGRTRR